MRFTILLLTLFALGACESDGTTADGGTTAAATLGTTEDNSAEAPVVKAGTSSTQYDFLPGGPIADTDLDSFEVVMSCSIGGEPLEDMVFEFWPEKAPISVRNFLRYASEGFYDGKKFHRIIKDFMIQGGCPQGTGMGTGPNGMILGEFPDNPGYEKGELAKHPKYKHVWGVLSMARSQDMNSASSQFFICNAAPDHLNSAYASFGKMTSGDSALTALSETDAPGTRPSAPCLIDKAVVRKK